MLRRCVVGIVLMAGVGATAALAAVPSSTLAEAEQRLAPWFAAGAVPYPPKAVALVALKAEARLELWAEAGAGAGWQFVRSYLLLAASGRLGPKLRQGDHQVPEGRYRISALNPDSHYHLSLRLDYPNAFDRARAQDDGRTRLGGDIMIHGDRVSDGCLPVGDIAVEELFALAARVGVESIEVVVSPLDLRRLEEKAALARAEQRPPWLAGLYAELAETLRAFPLPPRREPATTAPARRTRSAKPKCAAYDAADCLARCQAGDLTSCARAGILYRDGRRVARDTASAWSLLQRACSAGDALGCGALSELALSDDGLQRDASRAAELARVACDAGDGHGCHQLARLCADRLIYPASPAECSAQSVQRLRERAVAALRWDCRGWGAYDCATLASIYAPGDPRTARRLAMGSCESGDPGGCEELGLLYDRDGDTGRARSAYRRACETGFTSACDRLALATAAGPSRPGSLLAAAPRGAGDP